MERAKGLEPICTAWKAGCSPGAHPRDVSKDGCKYRELTTFCCSRGARIRRAVKQKRPRAARAIALKVRVALVQALRGFLSAVVVQGRPARGPVARVLVRRTVQDVAETIVALRVHTAARVVGAAIALQARETDTVAGIGRARVGGTAVAVGVADAAAAVLVELAEEIVFDASRTAQAVGGAGRGAALLVEHAWLAVVDASWVAAPTVKRLAVIVTVPGTAIAVLSADCAVFGAAAEAVGVAGRSTALLVERAWLAVVDAGAARTVKRLAVIVTVPGTAIAVLSADGAVFGAARGAAEAGGVADVAATFVAVAAGGSVNVAHLADALRRTVLTGPTIRMRLAKVDASTAAE